MERFPRSVLETRVLPAVAVVSYLWLCLAWFDHELNVFVSRSHPGVPVMLIVGSLAAIAWRRRESIRLGIDGALALGLALASLLSRAPFLFGAYGLFSSDAAAQGVMALHILEGRHHPIFLYNWSYVGSLKAHLAALLAWVTGEPVVSFAATAILIYAAFTAAVYAFARTVLFRPEAIVAAAYVILAPGFLTGWGMGNEGNYVDVMVFGTAMLALAARWIRRGGDGRKDAFWMGVLGGLAFWTHILATYYLLTALGVLAFHRWRDGAPARVGVFVLGFALGDFPGLLWNASNDWLSFRWWSLDAQALGAGERLSRAVSQLGEVLTTSFAVLSGWWPRDARPWPEPVSRVVLAFVIPASFGLFIVRYRRAVLAPARGKLSPESLLVGFAALVVLVFVQSSFGWMTEEPRYLLFLLSVVPVAIAAALGWIAGRSWLAAVVVAALLLFVNLRGDYLYLSLAWKSDTVNRAFLERLDKLGVRYVHSDYHLSYKYVFLSHGRMTWTSALGPSQVEWYQPFREQVAAADRVALVPRSFRFARRLERRLKARNIRYRREDLLYPVLFDFSEPVHLEELR